MGLLDKTFQKQYKFEVFATRYKIRTSLSHAKLNYNLIKEAELKDEILEQFNRYYSQKEYLNFKALALFLENPEHFLKIYFLGWKDTYKLLFEKPPAFHYDETCPFLNSDFHNIVIPEAIQRIPDREKREDAIFKVRRFASDFKNQPNQHNQTLIEALVQFIKSELKLAITEQDIKEINKPNSGVDITELDYYVNKTMTEIRAIINKSKSRLFSTQDLRDIVQFREDQFNYTGTLKHRGIYMENDIYNKLRVWRQVIYYPIKNKTRDHIFSKFNKRNVYNEATLRALHFQPCRSCAMGGRL